jgi:FtsP/CotA-like multicopper oxidase with cupredoxin domain
MIKRFGPAAVLMALVACGGGDTPPADADAPATPAPATPVSMPAVPTGPVSIPDWYEVDNDARTIAMTITAGATPDNNHWNYNGATRGSQSIVVPEGYTVRIELVNRDPLMAHSLGIQSDFTNPLVPPVPMPAFEGAITPNPQSMTEGTMPGQSATVEFVADTAGQYAMVCYVPGHTAVGMWLYFEVSAAGDAGVRGL